MMSAMSPGAFGSSAMDVEDFLFVSAVSADKFRQNHTIADVDQKVGLPSYLYLPSPASST